MPSITSIPGGVRLRRRRPRSIRVFFLIGITAWTFVIPASVNADTDSRDRFAGSWNEYGLWAALAVSSGALEHWPLNTSHPLLPTDDRSYIEKERVPDWLGAAGGLALGGTIWLADGPNHTHAHGYVTAVGVNVLTTALAKSIAGRKRPNYHDARSRGLHDETDTKSFWSGHASTSFCAATYGTLFLWNRTGSPVWRTAGTALLYGGATYSAWSRVVEHRHHISDVVTGALAGTLTSVLVFRWYERMDEEPSRTGDISIIPAGRAVVFSFRW